MFIRYPSLSVRSAGTSRNAKKRVSSALIRWADVICVMEEKHKERLMAEYRDIIQCKSLHILDIEDDYIFMDPELVSLLKDIVPEKLGLTVYRGKGL